MCASEKVGMESSGEETGRSAPPAPHTPSVTQPNGSNKIIGRNVNGTIPGSLSRVFTGSGSNVHSARMHRDLANNCFFMKHIKNKCVMMKQRER
ncbi:unnamed protein product [Diatraea saccharalis]|uniref:Uncharacterized protein n=1 Tax=Diatraea saccharalis TaxID=40085 RepID=A0A9N9RBU5_9NEOP|nr:unnamed protein product [Diatraea saccharalis]